ncbi:MAG: transposase [Planctomycetia bacterium]|nr:transposase [Planctomycetia bacterium]
MSRKLRGRVLDGDHEAKIIALRLGELRIVGSVGRQTLCKLLKTEMSARKIQFGSIRQTLTAAMKDVLETYKKPFDPHFRVICMDEHPIQLLDDVREPIHATKNHLKRTDYECKRCGTASILMFCEPFTGWCRAQVRERRTKNGWAEDVDFILEFFLDAERITLVYDNLNTHVYGSFYDTFPAAKARKLCTQIDLRHTPVPRPPYPPHRPRRVERTAQCQPQTRRLAVQNRGRQSQTEINLSQFIRRMQQ